MEQPKPQVKQVPQTVNHVQEPVATSRTVLKPFGSNGSAVKKNLLDVLKEKAAESGRELSEVKEAELLSIEKLQDCWNIYTERLTSTSAMTFRAARLALETDTSFFVTVNSLTQQKFIEQERMMLNDHIQKSFCNPIIKFSIKVEEGEKTDMPQHMILNSRQRFEKIAAMYPLVKELKDKLKLELDY